MSVPDARFEHLVRFYSILDELEIRIGGARRLVDCDGRMFWPKRGVYFFREPGENRSGTGEGPRIVRVGTHALKLDSRTTLWKRLSQHKGDKLRGSGNHRGSIFRLLVGVALIRRRRYECPTWGDTKRSRAEVKEFEHSVECEVSRVIGSLPFLWVAVNDAAGPNSIRGRIERNAIALLSDFGRTSLDPPSQNWLGHCCDRERVNRAGLWNNNHVEERFDPSFLDDLERLVEGMKQEL